MAMDDGQEIEPVQEAEADELRSTVLAKLIEKSVAEVRIEFDGSCDEGQIENVTCTKVDGTPGALDWPCGIPGKVTSTDAGWSSGARVNTPAEQSRPMTMHELLDE